MIGVLKQKTEIHTAGGTTITLEKATLVEKVNEKLYFNEYPDLIVVKESDRYIANYYGIDHLIVFPKGGNPYYPLSLL